MSKAKDSMVCQVSVSDSTGFRQYACGRKAVDGGMCRTHSPKFGVTIYAAEVTSDYVGDKWAAVGVRVDSAKARKTSGGYTADRTPLAFGCKRRFSDDEVDLTPKAAVARLVRFLERGVESARKNLNTAEDRLRAAVTMGEQGIRTAERELAQRLAGGV